MEGTLPTSPHLKIGFSSFERLVSLLKVWQKEEKTGST